MPCDVSLLSGISPELALQLRAAGINNSDRLLAAVSTPSMREELAHRLQIAPDILLTAGRCAEFVRIHGIGNVYADMLTHAGVGSLPELAVCDPEDLHHTLQSTAIDINVYRLPGMTEVQDWTAQARELAPILQA